MENNSYNSGERGLRPSGVRIVTNHALDLSHIEAIGLDLDHTLAVYDERRVNQLALAETCRNLIRYKGYPDRIKNLRYERPAVARGLVMDLETGFTLKCDLNDVVIRAFARREPAPPHIIRDRYGSKSLDLDTPRFVTLDSTFDLPAALLFGELEAPEARGEAGALPYRALCEDVREMLDRAHTRGQLKTSITAELRTMIAPVPGLAGRLEAFRSAGKKLFVLTNSEFEYTVPVLNYLFPGDTAGRGWRALFDVVSVRAGKPGYFTREEPAATRSNSDGQSIILSGGGAGGLETLLGASGQRIWYVGDNPVDDAQAARQRGWRTGLVFPEMGSEEFQTEAEPDGGRDWGNPVWDGGRATRMARIVREYSDVCAAGLGQFFGVPPDHVFDTV